MAGRKAQPRTRPRFEGRTAIVTAAGAGIGEAIALEWSQGGGRTVVSDLDPDAAAAVAAGITESGGEAVAVPADVTTPDAAATLVETALAAFGGIDALFNVAGANLPRRVDEMNDEEWYRVIDINLTSVYRCSKHVIPVLRGAGGGVIVNISSTAGVLAENRCAAYSASKSGVIQLTRNMAMDYARDGIRVNVVCPGGTSTPRIQAQLKRHPGHDEIMATLCPMQRFSRPDEIAKPAVFLASDDASYITGAALVVDGGLTAGKHFAIFEEA